MMKKHLILSLLSSTLIVNTMQLKKVIDVASTLEPEKISTAPRESAVMKVENTSSAPKQEALDTDTARFRLARNQAMENATCPFYVNPVMINNNLQMVYITGAGGAIRVIEILSTPDNGIPANQVLRIYSNGKAPFCVELSKGSLQNIMQKDAAKAKSSIGTKNNPLSSQRAIINFSDENFICAGTINDISNPMRVKLFDNEQMLLYSYTLNNIADAFTSVRNVKNVTVQPVIFAKQMVSKPECKPAALALAPKALDVQKGPSVMDCLNALVSDAPAATYSITLALSQPGALAAINNDVDGNNTSALFYAVYNGNYDAVSILLANGATRSIFKAATNNNKTPLWWAVYKNDTLMVNTLINGAFNGGFATNDEIIKWLQAAINMADTDPAIGQSPLAMCAGNPERSAILPILQKIGGETVKITNNGRDKYSSDLIYKITGFKNP